MALVSAATFGLDRGDQPCTVRFCGASPGCAICHADSSPFQRVGSRFMEFLAKSAGGTCLYSYHIDSNFIACDLGYGARHHPRHL